MQVAILYSVGANGKHGLRRPNKDKRRAVEMFLIDDEWCQWNNSELARRCGVSHEFVRQLRNNTSCNDCKIDTPAPRKVERGGTVYTQDTGNIG